MSAYLLPKLVAETDANVTFYEWKSKDLGFANVLGNFHTNYGFRF